MRGAGVQEEEKVRIGVSPQPSPLNPQPSALQTKPDVQEEEMARLAVQILVDLDMDRDRRVRSLDALDQPQLYPDPRVF